MSCLILATSVSLISILDEKFVIKKILLNV